MDTKKITEKITLPIAIVIVAVILVIGFYAVQSLKLQEQKEQTQKEYIAKRKIDCLNIYKIESNKWNNVREWHYGEHRDQCFIVYKDPNPKNDAKCDELYPMGDDGDSILELQNLLCKDGEFLKSF